MKPEISVVIPTYNRADKIVRAINSVLAQTYTCFELIIADDCSTDNTREVVEDITDARIKYVKLEKNSGAGGARNYGASIAQGKYIAFHDSDDEWLPTKLEKQFCYMESHPDAGMVYTKMHNINKNEEVDFPNETVEGDLEGSIYPWLLCRNTIGAPTIFVRKHLFDASKGFDASLRCLEDWEFVVRFSKNYYIGYIDEPLINVYSDINGVSHNTGSYYETRCKMIAENKDVMVKLQIFDEVIVEIFTRAQASGVLPQVQQMLMIALQNQ